MTDEALAAALLAKRREAAARAKACGKRPPSYYLLNINHPAIAAAYRRWREKAGFGFAAPGDKDRTLFEINMLSPEGRALLEQEAKVETE